jgi:hypothetical protein
VAVNEDYILAMSQGTSSVAPTGTAAPTGMAAATTPWVDLGAMSTEGLTEDLATSRTEFKRWGSISVFKTVITDQKHEFKVKFLETSPAVLGLFYRVPTPTPDATTDIISVTDDITGKLDPRAFLFDVLEGTNHIRFYVPKGEVTTWTARSTSWTASWSTASPSPPTRRERRGRGPVLPAGCGGLTMTKAPENEKDAAQAVKAEAVGKRLEDGSTLVPLTTDEGTVEILLPPPALWYEGAVEHLSAGRISEWVKLAVEDQESVDLWNSRRKRYRDLDAFLTAWSNATGENPGESSGSSAS